MDQLLALRSPQTRGWSVSCGREGKRVRRIKNRIGKKKEYDNDKKKQPIYYTFVTFTLAQNEISFEIEQRTKR